MSYGTPPSQYAFPPVTTSLIGACAVMFLLQDMFRVEVMTWLPLWPVGDHPRAPGFYPWQLVTYGFLHGSFLHILVNMYVLWMFGIQIENLWGSRRFALYYLVCVVGAALVQLVVVSAAASGGGNIIPTVGASGGVLGVLLAFGRIYPNQMIMLLIPPMPIKAKYLVIIIGALSLLAGMTGAMGGVAHFAHLGGMLFGFGLLLYWESKHGRGRF